MRMLADTQAAFARALFNPNEPAPGEIRRPGSAATVAAQTKRFDVYRNNVVAAATGALGDTFPAVRALVGDDFFEATARAYFDTSPPHSPLLFRYGATFGDFLETFHPAARSVPYLGDVARLEYARLQAYHAADVVPLEIAALGAVPPDDVAGVTFDIHPAVSLIRSSFPVVSLWAASTGLMSLDDVDMKKAEDALTARPGLDVDTRILPAGGAAFVDALIDGRTLGDAAESAMAAAPAFELSEHLAGLFGAGAFIRVNLHRMRTDPS